MPYRKRLLNDLFTDQKIITVSKRLRAECFVFFLFPLRATLTASQRLLRGHFCCNSVMSEIALLCSLACVAKPQISEMLRIFALLVQRLEVGAVCQYVAT